MQSASAFSLAEIALFAGTLRVPAAVTGPLEETRDLVQTTSRLLNWQGGDAIAEANGPQGVWRRVMIGGVGMDDPRAGVRRVARELWLCAHILREYNRAGNKP